MDLDKQQVIDHLRARGENDRADRAESELHETVDTERDAAVLNQLGIDPKDLPSQLPAARHLKNK